MMRKMVGTDDDVKYGVPPGFQRPIGPGPSNGPGPNTGAAGMPHLPPNMMPEAIMYNKFQQSGAAGHNPPYFHNGDPSASTHLHKMEGLLKPCFEDHSQHHQQQQQHQYGNYGAGNFATSHHHQQQQQQQQHHHQHSFGPNSNMMESPFVNSFNGGGNQKGGAGDVVQIKQENDTFGGLNGKPTSNDVLTMYGRNGGGVGSNSSSNPISGSNNSVSSKAEPNEFNLNYSNSAIKGENNHTADDDSGIDKLTRLNDNDGDQ